MCIISKTKQKSERFSQNNPFSKCNHPCKFICDDPRCSFQGHNKWARNLAAIVVRLLSIVGYSQTLWRGNLSFIKGTSPDGCRNIIATFLRSIRIEKKRTGKKLEVLLIQHPQKTTCHFEFFGYGDTHWATTIRRLWTEAGGHHPTCKAMTFEHKVIEGMTVYYFKAGKKYPNVPTHLAERNNGLQMTYSTQGFFQGVRDILWQQVCAKWHRKENKLIRECSLERITRLVSE